MTRLHFWVSGIPWAARFGGFGRFGVFGWSFGYLGVVLRLLSTG